MTSCVRVLSTQTLDSSPSILLVAPNGKKTLVNCGEGCQRIFLEFGQKVSTIDRVCLTHLGYETIGGLPGMILTASDVLKQATDHAKQAAAVKVNNKQQEQHKKKGRKSDDASDSLPIQPGLKLLGPDGTHRFFRSLRHFMRRESFRIDIQEGAYVERESHDSAINTKKKKKKHDSSNEDFQVQSIVACLRTDPFTNKYTFSNADTESNLDSVEDTALSPSKKRPKITGDEHSTPPAPPVEVETPTPTENPLRKRLQNDQTSREILSFLFTTPPIQGKFLIEKAKALGVPKGPLYGQLKAGKTITFTSPPDNGGESTTVTVESHQVVEPGSPGVVVAILCYPNFSVLDQLRTSKELQQFKCQTQEKSTVIEDSAQKKKQPSEKFPIMELVVHMTTTDIFNSESCVSWRKSFFEGSVRHMFLCAETSHTASMNSEENRGSMSAFQSAHIGAFVRSQVCSHVYKAPTELDVANDNNTPNSISSEENKFVRKEERETNDDELSSVAIAKPLLEYVLLPRSRRGFCNHDLFYHKWKRMQEEARNLLDSSGCIDRAEKILDTNNLLTEATMVKDASGRSNIAGEILFTGTGSAIPCKHRNVSGIYVRMDNGNAMLLDVGEGTIGQLLRAKQREESLSNVVKGIKAVWISHPHADHHLGIIRLLEERQRLVSDHDPLVLIAPRNILGFLREYESVESRIADSYIFLDCQDLKTESGGNFHGDVNHNAAALQKLDQDLGIVSCTAIPVAHCANSFAVVFRGTSFGSLAYSGDCRPSRNFSRIAYGADLLIHEATFADGMEADAVVKRHCTVGEALTVAKDMNAKTIILTHFSQRYPKIPVLADADDAQTKEVPACTDVDSSLSSSHDMNVIHAFDFMAITASNIPVASKITPALQLLYPDKPEDAKENSPVEMSDARAALEVPGLFAQSELL